MYKKGDLRLVTPPCETADEDGDCDYEGVHAHSIYDSRVPTTDPQHNRTAPGVFLPHLCGAWVIGGLEEIDSLVTDLIAAREELTRRNT